MLHDAQTDQFEHLDNLQQHGRRENLEFEGVPLIQHEDATEIDKLFLNSEYYDADSINTKFITSKSKNILSFMHFDIRSLSKNVDIAISETK